MAEAVLSFVAERLGVLLKEKASSLRSVRDNVERLKEELIWMQGFLKDAEASPQADNKITIQNMVAEVRDLAYDAEDIIESHAFAAKECILRRMVNSWSVASKIDKFSGRINELGRRQQTYGRHIGEAGDRSGTQQKLLQPPRRTYSHIAEQHVIGLEEDAETIAAKLIDGMLRSRAVSICGMGGVGKTTLAKEIYHNMRVREHFKCVAWEHVSQRFNPRDIWKGILISLTQPSEEERRPSSELSDREIAKKLYQLLENEKCLVVLDDIWTKDAWDCLRDGFPETNTESKILLTTRNRDVALHVDSNCFIHTRGCLNEKQSWELFLHVVIHHHREEGFTFDEDLGKKIVNECHGLPLAIKTIGGTLQTKSSIHDWEMVYNNMVSHFSRTDNGLTEPRNRIMSLLALSYHDLPYHLKQCFLHFSQFPEDFVIPADTIIDMWVAEGIILKGSRGDSEVEDIAYACLLDLASRHMVQVEKWSLMGRIKSCRLHDLMRDLCIQEAGKENFFHPKYLEHGHDEATNRSTSIGKVRRLALYMKNSSREPCANSDTYAHVRSLLVFCNNMDPVFLNKSLLVAMTRHFKYLRLLYLDGFKRDLEIPKEIGYLVHLRLLDMGSMRTEQLPSSLGKLTQLLTLKLDGVSGLDNVPNTVENMHQLRHLYLPRSSKFSSGSMNLSLLKNLRTLVNLPLRNVKIEDLVGLRNLRKLKIKASVKEGGFKRLVEMLSTSPGTSFNKLQYLSVGFGMFWRWRGGSFEITKVAASFPNLHKLKLTGPLVLDISERSQIFFQLNKLTLIRSNFAENPMPHLGKLPNLGVLHLCLALGDAIMFPKNSFPRLQYLVLSWEMLLKEWIIEEGALPRLTLLRLFCCLSLKTLPEGLEFLDSLQELQIGAMPPAFTERIMRGGEDFHKVENVRIRFLWPPPRSKSFDD